jgi:MFS transporter, PAT family, beta-lactamase induction signal transducer AmpG
MACDSPRVSTAVIGPFRDFMQRPLWPVILIAIFGYKLGEAMAGVMSTPLYISLGFSLPEIAAASKVFGFFSIVAGVMLGGVVTTRYGIRRSLILCGILQSAGTCFLFCRLWVDIGSAIWLYVSLPKTSRAAWPGPR